MAHYSTRARRQITEYLNARPDQGYTAEELAQALQEQYGQEAPGKSSVYRLLGQLAQEELLHKYEEEGSKRSYYRAVGSHCHEHLHLKCVVCGGISHLECAFMDEISEHILKDHGFVLQCRNSIIYGTCKACREK